jgi:hypothetical protein
MLEDYLKSLVEKNYGGNHEITWGHNGGDDGRNHSKNTKGGSW